MRLTSSSLERVDACPASVVLGGYPDQGIEAEHGKRNHVDAENGEVHPELKTLMDTMAAVEQETAFVVDTKHRRVVRTGKARRYGYMQKHDIGTTPDWIGVIADKPSHVRIIDFKSRRRVTHPRENLQIITQAVAVFETYGCNYVEAGLGYLDNGFYDSYEFSRFELPGMWARLEEVVRKANSAKPTQLQTGSHCEYCPSLLVCPAQRQAMQALVKDGDAIETALETMPAEKVASVYTQLIAAEKILERVRKAATRRIKREPIDMPNGKVLRMVESSTKKTDWEGLAFELEQHGKTLNDFQSRTFFTKLMITNKKEET